MGFKSSYLYCCAFLAFLLIACKKEINSAGVNSLGVDNSKVMTIDSFDIETGSIIDDNIITTNPAYLLLGSYNDKDLGVCSASFCSELSLTSYNLNLNPDTVDFESSYLTITVNESSFSGKISPQSFKVFQLRDSLYTKNYYSSSTINVDPSEVSELSNNLEFKKQAINSDSNSLNYTLSIPIKKEFAFEILNESKKNSNVFTSQAEFRKRFKGLQVTAEPQSKEGEGAVFYIASSPRLTINYIGLKSQKKQSFSLELKSTGTRLNQVKFSDSNKGVISPSTVNEKFYAQSNRLKGYVLLPSIQQKLPKNAVIHKAELSLPFEKNDNLSVSSEVSLALRNSPNENSFRISNYSSVNLATSSYNLDIKQYIQKVITGKVLNWGLVVAPKFYISSGEKITFLGAGSKSRRPMLIVKYSTL
ncbi:MAG: DUF4270 family protein [Crocinitomicaceae bacterium]|nr:DUF4270 family protein [Crocinitomicaceae bacterium]